MLFYKPLFSFVVAFAAASSVVASTIPVARGGGEYPPPSPKPTNVCGQEKKFCCDTWTNSKNPALGVIGPLSSILDGNLIDGFNCEGVFSGGTW
jgi:hypothetical protein